MTKYKIVYNRNECIAFGGCAAASNFFIIGDNGKADLVNAKSKNGIFELDIENKDFSKNKDAAELCPVKVIKIIDLKTGKYVV